MQSHKIATDDSSMILLVPYILCKTTLTNFFCPQGESTEPPPAACNQAELQNCLGALQSLLDSKPVLHHVIDENEQEAHLFCQKMHVPFQVCDLVLDICGAALSASATRAEICTHLSHAYILQYACEANDPL